MKPNIRLNGLNPTYDLYPNCVIRNIIMESSINEYALYFKGLLSMEGVICFLGVKNLRGAWKYHLYEG